MNIGKLRNSDVVGGGCSRTTGAALKLDTLNSVLTSLSTLAMSNQDYTSINHIKYYKLELYSKFLI